MGNPDYVDLRPDAVTASGTRTAGTSSDWAGWAGRSGTTLRNTAGGSRQARVTNAFETYLSRWNPTLQGLALRAEGLGTNAVSASNVMDGADGEAAGVLQTETSTAQTQATHLRRPINGYH